MAFQPYAAARDHRATPSAYQTSTATAYSEFNVTTTSSLDSAASNAVLGTANYIHDLQDSDSHSPNTTSSDEQVLPTGEQIDQEIYEAKIARIQGRISTAEYGKILVAGLEKGSARLERQRRGLRRALKGEDSRESIIRDAGLTDAEGDILFQRIRRTINLELVNGRRGEARRLRRAITRGQ
ncbi:hypothetical protein DENSPDRAFT_843307 [Dentipellis sp. KUC8613]|nr:hypothetical protein DENSPDRAFT_843307 [Dentipellis sp. KUC8613]